MAVAGAPWQLEFENVEQRCGYLLTSGIWSDCTFMVGLESSQVAVPAHKLVLAMASPVFEKMFCGGLGLSALSDRNELNICDVQPEAFRALLQYIYTGNTDIDSLDMAWGLLHGAKKYMLPHLLTKCNRYICSVLAPRNVCRAYELAHLYDEKPIMDKCIQIISKNTKEILNDSSFKDIELKTLIQVCSLDHLEVDSELDLYFAVEKYAKAEQKSELRTQPPTAEEKVLQSPSQKSPAAETADEGNFKEEGRRATIREAIEKIRFLSLSPAQFAAGPARSGLLTRDEALAVLMNIASPGSAEPMPRGFSECRQRRQPPSTSVEQERFAMPRLEPESSFGVTATKLLTPAEVVSGLLSDEQEKLEHAVRAVRDRTCDNTFGSQFFFTELFAAGGIPPLVAALNHPSDAGPVLVGVLGRGAPAMAELAARALGSIADIGDGARDAVVNAGAPAALLAHMQPSTPSAPLRTYVRTYRILCRCTFFPSSWTQSRFDLLSPAVPNIEKLLLLDDEQVLAEACRVLTYLADGAHLNPQVFTAPLAARLTALLQPAAAPDVQAAALGTVSTMLETPELRELCLGAGGLDAIINIIKCGDPSNHKDVQTAALETVAAMLGTPELGELCLGAGCLDYIIHFLKCGDPSYVQHAARAADKMLSTTRDIQTALEKGMLDALVPALTEEDKTCKSSAVSAITSLCVHGYPAQLRELVASSALQPYCRTMTDGGYNARDNVLQGISSILMKVEENTKVALFLKLREIGVPQLLINAQRHGDRHHRQRAINLLQTYFKDDQ